MSDTLTPIHLHKLSNNDNIQNICRWKIIAGNYYNYTTRLLVKTFYNLYDSNLENNNKMAEKAYYVHVTDQYRALELESRTIPRNHKSEYTSSHLYAQVVIITN